MDYSGASAPLAGGKMEPENKYLPELMAEKDSLDPSFTHAMQLLTAGTGSHRRGGHGRGSAGRRERAAGPGGRSGSGARGG